jgi:tetratricopeptide (TPR) repeat protein
MSAHLQRAQLLLQQSRPVEAEQEAGLALAHAPDDAHAHALLALSRVHQQKHAPAIEAARAAVRCAPDSPYGHYIHALVLHRCDRNRQAQAAIDEAIRLDPEDADAFTLLASIHLALGDWPASLAAAEQALALSPEHVDAANFRAMALVRLGRKTEAAATVDFALHRDPENAFSHANQGWNCLHRDDPQGALTHFREALRLDPDLDYAREGMLEALKARNPVYRLMLAYFLWTARVDSRLQWGIMIGSYFASRFINGLAVSQPSLAPVAWVVLPLLYGFIYLTWTAQPMFNLFLRLDPFGRHVLSREQRVASNWFGPFFVAALAATVWFFINRGDVAFFAMFFAAALSICVAATFVRRASSRWILGAATAVLFLLAGVSFLPVFFGRDSVNRFAEFFVYGFLAFQLLTNALALRRE